MRNKKTMLVMHLGDKPYLHICDHGPKGVDAWYPLSGPAGQGTFFSQVEHVFVTLGIASNVTAIDHIRRCGKSDDYEVIYNEAPVLEVAQ
jgi:hypothetical protein